jgi:TRAP-type C4-dicarboxylate transport system permease small subunit
MRRRPRWAVAAAAEVLTALVLIGLAWWCWHRGVIVTIRRGAALNRIEGRWWVTAVGAATLAGILLLDVARRVMREGG